MEVLDGGISECVDENANVGFLRCLVVNCYPKSRNFPLSGFIEIYRKCITKACLSASIEANMRGFPGSSNSNHMNHYRRILAKSC